MPNYRWPKSLLLDERLFHNSITITIHVCFAKVCLTNFSMKGPTFLKWDQRFLNFRLQAKTQNKEIRVLSSKHPQFHFNFTKIFKQGCHVTISYRNSSFVAEISYKKIRHRLTIPLPTFIFVKLFNGRIYSFCHFFLYHNSQQFQTLAVLEQYNSHTLSMSRTVFNEPNLKHSFRRTFCKNEC